ncbi:MAG: cysteine--tRNA ligase [Cyanobacteria bacterium SIG30]|nr:cysteine--tRNA ligase [Cyanobacteria bacterium SIG30]
MLKLYNTISRKLEEFKPIVENKVKMYVCGPTVYDKAHLGHARCYITWDILYRYLKFLGYDVTYCRNVTDVDDKILKKADENGVTPDEVADEYYKSFANSMKALNVLTPDVEPRATKTLGEMIKMIKTLIEKDFAYELDGDVYFDIKKYKNYGKLSWQPIDDLMSGARVEENDKKRCPLDFALWKKDERHGYNSPWGVGRPGWHIECSAMSKKYLGDTIDIHAGGADLIFPHHENEVAQSECANGCTFVNYFLHNGFVTVNKEKMSKSLHNFKTIDDITETYDNNTIRFFILTNHYRMPVEFNDEALNSAKAGVSRLIANAVKGDKNGKLNEEFINEFKEAMNDDLNTSKALATLFSILKAGDFDTLAYLADALGFDLTNVKKELTKEHLAKIIEELNLDNSKDANAIMADVIEIRKQARSEKNWALSDKIRDILSESGISLKDSPEGTTWEAK